MGMEQINAATRAWRRYAEHQGIAPENEAQRARFIAGFIAGWTAGAKTKPVKEAACNT